MQNVLPRKLEDRKFEHPRLNAIGILANGLLLLNRNVLMIIETWDDEVLIELEYFYCWEGVRNLK